MKYEVHYWDEDFESWVSEVLEMCRPSRHCGCGDKGTMSDCDYMFNDVEEKQIALDKIEQLEGQGIKVKLVEIK